MTNAEILTLLKIDLQVSSTSLDDYLSTLIDAARAFIAKEGITLDDSAEENPNLTVRFEEAVQDSIN